MSRLRLVVFDLDFTLWDCGGTWCDCLTPPFSRSDGQVRDATGREIHLYKDVHRILDTCDQGGLLMALASRTEEPSWARELLALLGIDHRFAFSEIYPSSKLRHFDALLNQT
ncbi:MAG: magnesium-dependent phosphatase-1, partial [Planctomycetota bacterium]|nr:magnesium-dependent phosphatase-1 [Planctomycetota bacterium]